MSDPLDDMLDIAGAHARKVLIEHREERLMPLALMIDQRGDRLLVPMLWDAWRSCSGSRKFKAEGGPMSLITPILAFLGVAAAVSPKKDDEAERLRQLEHWADYLEEALGSERRLCAHWKEEARRLAVQAQRERQAQEAEENLRAYWAAHQQAQPQQSPLQALQLAQAHLQAYQPLQNPLAGLGQQTALNMPLGAFCNCVPARLDGLTGRLNTE